MQIANNRLSDKLVLVYPKEGISTADYPFMLLKENKRAEYIKIVQALKGDKIQKWLATQTGRRVVNEKVAEETAKLFPKETLIELSFPTDRVVIDSLLDSFMNKQKKPSAAIFIVDVSGSMSNEGREQQLKQAFDMLTGNDTSLTGRFSKFREREKVWVVPFSTDVKPVQYFEFGNTTASVSAMTKQLQQNINALSMDGGTALYSATKVGLDIAIKEQKAHPEYNYTVVLFTDGEVNHGISADDFIDEYLLTKSNIHVFPILFGQGNAKELEKVAVATKGKTFDGTKQKLTSVFKEIRGYQ